MGVIRVILWVTCLSLFIHTTQNAPTDKNSSTCPYPSLSKVCDDDPKGRDKYWCRPAQELQKQICQFQNLTTFKISFPTLQNLTIDQGKIKEFCNNTILKKLSEVTAFPVPLVGCDDRCHDSVACALTIVNLKFYLDLPLLVSKSVAAQISAGVNDKMTPNTNLTNSGNQVLNRSQAQSNPDAQAVNKVQTNDHGVSVNTEPVLASGEIPVAEQLKPEDMPAILPESALTVKATAKQNDSNITALPQAKPDTSAASMSPQADTIIQKETDLKTKSSPNATNTTKLSSSSPPPVEQPNLDESMAAIPPPMDNEPPQGDKGSSPKVELLDPAQPQEKNPVEDEHPDPDLLDGADDPGIEEDENDITMDKVKLKVDDAVNPKGEPGLPGNPADIGMDKDPNNSNGYGAPPDASDPLLVITDVSGGGYFQYFLSLLAFTFIGFILFHNKKRLIALVVEGRRPAGGSRRGRRRTSSTSGTYRKLENNFD